MRLLADYESIGPEERLRRIGRLLCKAAILALARREAEAVGKKIPIIELNVSGQQNPTIPRQLFGRRIRVLWIPTSTKPPEPSSNQLCLGGAVRFVIDRNGERQAAFIPPNNSKADTSAK